MADKWPLANGNWSSAANWNGGTKPVAGDTVYADGRTVTIDEDIDLSPGGSLNTSQRSGGTASGTFNVTTARSIKANIVGGTSTVLTTSHVSGTVTITGNITGGIGNSCFGINVNSSSQVNIVGNVSAGSGNDSYGIADGALAKKISITGNISGGTATTRPSGVVLAYSTNSLTIVGSITGANAGGSGIGLSVNAAFNSISITGNVTAGSTSSAHGLDLGGLGGTCTITGDITSSSGTNSRGVNCSSQPGTCIVNGNAIGGPNNPGVYIASAYTFTLNGTASPHDASGNSGIAIANSSAVVNIKRAKGSSYGVGSAGVVAGFGVSTSVAPAIYVEELEYGARGFIPVYGPFYHKPAANNVHLMRKADLTQVSLVPADNAATFGSPAASDVRSGVAYALGNLTGTLAVPAANQVAVGVAVDNTVGTATITAATLRSALGLASANLDTQLSGISSIKTKTDQLSFTVANQVDSNSLTGGLTQAQVRTAVGLASANLDTQLSGINTSVDAIDVNLTVVPLEAQRQLLAVGSDIYVKVRARSLVGFHVTDASGDAVNLDALNLLVTIESLDTLTEHTLANGDIQRSGDSFSFRIPAAVVEVPRQWNWSLREVGHDEHLIGGKIYVTYAP